MCDIGNNIKKYRRMAGLTQEELGNLSGLSTMSIRRYESNSRKPNIEQLRKISNALGIILGKLLEGNFKEYADEITEDFSSSGKKIPQSMQIEVPDKLGEQIEEAKRILSINPKDPKTRAQAKQVLNDVAIELGYKNERDFTINQIKMNISDLNEKGLHKVLELTQDLLMIKAYLVKASDETDKTYLNADAAHSRTDIAPEKHTEELKQQEDDMMDNDDLWK